MPSPYQRRARDRVVSRGGSPGAVSARSPNSGGYGGSGHCSGTETAPCRLLREVHCGGPCRDRTDDIHGVKTLGSGQSAWFRASGIARKAAAEHVLQRKGTARERATVTGRACHCVLSCPSSVEDGRSSSAESPRSVRLQPGRIGARRAGDAFGGNEDKFVHRGLPYRPMLRAGHARPMTRRG